MKRLGILSKKRLAIILLAVLAIVGRGTLYAQEIHLSSSDIGISSGSRVVVDGTIKGTAPMTLAFRFDVRHKIVTETGGVRAKEFYLTMRVLQKSKEIENIPAWFVTPTLHQSDFSGYASLTPATAITSSIESAMMEVENAVRSKMSRRMMNRYNTVQAGQGKLDSSSSSYYPNLTRGQMDSLADVNGGSMVVKSFPPVPTIEFLEYEIQKIGERYRVYVLAGSK